MFLYVVFVFLHLFLMFSGAAGLVYCVACLAQVHSSGISEPECASSNFERISRRQITLRYAPRFADEWFLVSVLVILNILALTSSSMIENEHAFWHHIAATWCWLRTFRSIRAESLPMIATTTTTFARQLRSILSTSAAKLSLPWLGIFLLVRLLREGTQVINFARLNHIAEPNFVGATAVIASPPASIDIANGGQEYIIFGTLFSVATITVWYLYSLLVAEDVSGSVAVEAWRSPFCLQ